MRIRAAVTSFVLLLAVLLVACARSPEGAARAPGASPSPLANAPEVPDAAVVVIADAQSSDAPQVQTEPSQPEEKKLAWTDDAVVDQLAKDCAYKPEELQDTDGVLSCSYNLFSQSCVPDPCHTEGQTVCRPKCQKSCASCDTACTSSCGACKKKCKGDATCNRECAKSCGACKEGCLGAKDRCATGTCGAAYAACSKRIKAEWNASGCAKACPVYNACSAKCDAQTNTTSSGDDACRGPCRNALFRVCRDPFAGMCIFTGVGPDKSMGDEE